MRVKFEARTELLRLEVQDWKDTLSKCVSVYSQTVLGHSYQSVTGQVPSAAERLMPTLEEIGKSPKDDETASVCTDATFLT